MLSQNRIHGRLQSTFWQSPRHRQHEARTPLYLEIQAVSLRIERLPCSKQNRFSVLSKKLNELCGLFKRVDAFAGTSSEAEDLLTDVAKQCYAVSTSDGKSTLEETVAGYGYTPNDVCRNKHIRQIYKIGRYWGLCLYMAEVSRKYDKLFKNIKLETIRPYRAIISPISFKGPPAKCHVHAEIQLLTFYGSNPNLPALKPRVLGVSKAACYLCNLFIREYAEFFVSKTHGQLYDQWNVPDLATFSGPQRLQYRTVLRHMDTELQTAERRERSRPRRQKRQEALGSWLDLTTAFPLSPIASDAGTVLSEAKSDATIPGPSGTKTPRALSAEAIPRSARAERLERRNLLKEVQDTRKVPGTPEEHPTTSSPNPARASPITTQPNPARVSPITTQPNPTRVSPIATQPNPVDLPLLSAGPSPQPRSLTSPPMASPMPPSPPISTPLPVNRDDLAKPRARIPLHQTPDIASSTAAELPSSPSSSSIQSWEYPIERTITTTSPFRSKHDKLSLTFEIEGTGHGNVAIAHFSGSKEPATGIPINLRAMKENEILHFEREHEADHLVLNLQHSGNQSTQLKLQWL